MGKREVLERSRRDGGMLDERERQQSWQDARIVLCVITILSAVLFVWDVMHGLSNPELVAVVVAGPMTMCALYYRRTREKTYLVFAVAGFVGIAVGLINHFLKTM